jgi:hypothetical protein
VATMPVLMKSLLLVLFMVMCGGARSWSLLPEPIFAPPNVNARNDSLQKGQANHDRVIGTGERFKRRGIGEL